MEYLENGIKVNNEFYLLQDIIQKCTKVKVEKENSVLLKIEWDGRGGNAYEYAVYPKDKAEKIKSLLLDKEVYFGEIWGKHSEVYGKVTEGDFSIIEDKEHIQNFLSYHPNGSDSNHSFTDAILDFYSDNGGRDWGEEEYGSEYCDDLEELKTLIYE